MEKNPNTDGGYAWIIMAAAFGIHYIEGSIFVGFSVLLVEFTDVFDEPKSVVGWTGAICTGVSCFTGLFFGKLSERFGYRSVAMCSGLILASGQLATSFSRSIYMTYITYGFLSGVGMGGISLATVVAVQKNFTARRTFATGISLMGASIGGFTFTPVFRLLVYYLGWRQAVIAHSALSLQSVVFGALLRPVPEKNEVTPTATESESTAPSEPMLDTARRPDLQDEPDDTIKTSRCTLFDAKVLKMPMFLVFLVGNVLCDFGILTIYQHSSSRAVVKNIDKIQSSLIPSAIGICSTTFRLISSIVGNLKCTNVYLYSATVSTAGGVVLCLSCLTSSHIAGSVTTAALYGVFLGQMLTLISPVLVSIVGIDNVEMANGWYYSITGVAEIIAVPLSGLLFDLTGNYDVPFLVMGITHICGGLCLFIIPINKRMSKAAEKDENKPVSDIEHVVDT